VRDTECLGAFKALERQYCSANSQPVRRRPLTTWGYRHEAEVPRDNGRHTRWAGRRHVW